jgi:hypothetical protein
MSPKEPKHQREIILIVQAACLAKNKALWFFGALGDINSTVHFKAKLA